VDRSSSPEAARQLTVAWLDDDRHLVTVRGHHLVVDQPPCDGGGDAGPTPVELFVASLASCVAHYARRALGSGGGGPSIRCSWTMSESAPFRVTGIDIDVDLPSDTSPARLAAVERATAHCTVHNTLKDPPVVRVRSAVAMRSN
jgi:putative redox protein